MSKRISGRVQLVCDDPSLTHQSFKAECDIRNIMKKYKKTGVLTHVTSMNAQYLDASVVPDYQEALNLIISAQDTFDSLPSELRKRFNNDPAEFLSFTSNSDNRLEMAKLGLLNDDVTRSILENPTPKEEGAPSPT